MKLDLREPDSRFISASQKAKDITEAWVASTMFCPNCGNHRLNQFPPNLAVADFFCAKCQDQYELKSQKKPFGKKLANGAYSTKIERLNSDTSPNLILMSYTPESLHVRNLLLVPKRFFVPDIVEKRPPLKETARRAGWVGSNIVIEKIPDAGKIFIVRNGAVTSREHVIQQWHKTAFLSGQTPTAKGWLLDVMRCVDRIGSTSFTLDDVYAFEHVLSKAYPENNNIRPKIRQQLQVLRDNGYLEFLGGGQYRLNG